MTVASIEPPAPERAADDTADELLRLGDILLASGAIDRRTLDRARRVAAETGGRLDRVMTQLGMISERGLAEALAELVGAPLIGPADYPEAPLFTDRLKAKFLRKAHILPIAADGDEVVLATADPIDRFVREAIAAALERPVRIAVAVPIELEAAFDRLYAEAEGGTDAGGLLEEIVAADEPSEEDAERLKDLASEAPVIRLVNQLIARAVESRRRRGCRPPSSRGSRSWPGSTSPSAGCRRMAASASACAATRSIFASQPCRRSMAKRSCFGCSTAPPSSSITTSSAWRPT
jgi:general secretion pathway protein E